jgi:hypothetical protein
VKAPLFRAKSGRSISIIVSDGRSNQSIMPPRCNGRVLGLSLPYQLPKRGSGSYCYRVFSVHAFRLNPGACGPSTLPQPPVSLRVLGISTVKMTVMAPFFPVSFYKRLLTMRFSIQLSLDGLVRPGCSLLQASLDHGSFRIVRHSNYFCGLRRLASLARV